RAGSCGFPAAGNSVTTPAVVMRPILPTKNSVNHRLPSAPTVMPPGWAAAVVTGKSEIVCDATRRAVNAKTAATARRAGDRSNRIGTLLVFQTVAGMLSPPRRPPHGEGPTPPPAPA